MWGFAQIVAPSSEPVILADVKNYLRVDVTDDDTLIQSLIAAARRRVERHSERQLMAATWQMTLDTFWDLEPRSRWSLQAVPGQEDLIPQLRGIGVFSAGNVIRLPKSPLQSVISVQYVDLSGTTQTLDPSLYLVDTTGEPGRIAPAFGKFWPPTLRVINAVTITFTAGYATVPDEIKLAVLRIVGLYYVNRDATADSPALEQAIDDVIRRHWIGEF